jgi:uncharacterized alpha-E superfamily protein
MLSRAAQSLFWLGRYIERADATARLLEMGRRMTMLPGSNEVEEWRSVARASGSAHDLAASSIVKAREVQHRLLFDPENRSSIRSCFLQARANGRAARTALTQDMWEALNEGWRTLDTLESDPSRADLPALIDWTKRRAAAVRGAMEMSLLRNDGYIFLRLGELIERCDMTLRLLDVKYYVLLPETDVVGGGRDYHQWTAVLHATSALRAYHHVNRGGYTPWGIAELLILNPAFPRSVRFCQTLVFRLLDDLASQYGERTDCQDQALRLSTDLDRREIGALFQSGLHEFIGQTIERTRALSVSISRAYHF